MNAQGYDVETYLASRLNEIEKALDQLVLEQESLPQRSLFAAARYSLLSQGKRLRPLLTLATAESLQGSMEKALIPACALECVHTYSLIHDDLPCMDDDELRRGRPTLHKVYPEGHAVLTGDFLLTYAFEILTTAPSLDPIQKLKLIEILASRSGSEGMIGGQVLDIALEGKPISWDLLQYIHKAKTGALISASLEFGGVIAGVNDDTQKTLHTIGMQIGLAFQMVDDLLDNKEEGKTSCLSLLGIEQTKEYVEGLLSSSLALCHNLPGSCPLLQSLLCKLVHRST